MRERPGALRRPQVRFLILFVVMLGVGFTFTAIRAVDEAVIGPYTAMVARLAGSVLGLLGEDVTVSGCVVRSPRFAVTIHNGCNGLVISLVLAAGVFAFPVAWRTKVAGLLVGLVAVQLINLVRVLSLFYTGVYLPRFFNESHVVVWQSVVILSGVALWVVWARWAVTRTENGR